MNPLSDFDLNRSAPEEENDTKALEEAIAPNLQEATGGYQPVSFTSIAADAYNLTVLPQLPPFNPMGEVLQSAPFFFSQPFHGGGYDYPGTMGNMHAEQGPPPSFSPDFNGTIAPHQMHINPWHGDLQNDSRSPGAPPAGSSGENAQVRRFVSESSPSRFSRSLLPLVQPLLVASQQEEPYPAAGPSRITFDVAHAVTDPAESNVKVESPEATAIDEPPAKRRRRSGVDLQGDSPTRKAKFCGIGKCKWQLTTSEANNRKHVRDEHYKVGSAYKAGSSSSSGPSGSQSPSEISTAGADSDEAGRLPCQHGSCNSTFGRMQDLMKHIESTHWGRRFKCQKCGGTFSHRWSLERHRKDDCCKGNTGTGKPRTKKK
ncbi:hypothetical protein NUW54_g1205 [Trametes sanguinea]|uniref:Uncharacterized protein n=1 Tax=Trametes sanguinea TaxID=158606 RepID=A0ACC1Q9Q4_9APHY|nr:hypothetical protein NUW54_g1205 [Trametes sanguinea]